MKSSRQSLFLLKIILDLILARRYIFLILVLTVFAAGCSSYWVRKADKIKIGMSRPEVEKILPMYNDSPYFVSAEGDTIAYTYWVAPDWKVTLYYDFYGMNITDTFHLDWSKADSVRVIGLPDVTKEKMMVMKPLSY